ncbi:bifunctional diguanylate cyclase/phosphodiesterase [Paenibacillus sp. DYY-L-2]|uniref:bifunctional diguanylate cyclase/phosphodiesterase n=1 Tax=Paenibacillus sp. DYY-L-2 TaxID=3447013 RepID=UPI003F503450
MEGSYNYFIVVLSVIISVVASYSALSITARISRSDGVIRLFWICAGSFVMGTGVWAMHFVGMLAFHMGMKVKYDVWLTLLSMAVSVVSSFIAFYITLPKVISRIKLVVGGFSMGIGIVAMHYVGMEAMILPGRIVYAPFYLILSICIALVASYAALFLFIRFRNQQAASWLKWLSAVMMGLAVCGMHYTGMQASHFDVQMKSSMLRNVEVDFFLVACVTVVIFAIFIVSWGAIFFDRYVLERMAFRDTVTGLPNRNEMNRFFASFTSKEEIGIFYLDLDQFKAVNDTLGHHIGDLLIDLAGRRLRHFTDNDRKVFRIGGDEFLLIAAPCGEEQAKRLAEQMLQSLKETYTIQGNELYITASIGICIASIRTMEPSTMLKRADTAMYKAKDAGRNQYCIYTEEMGLYEVRRMELEKDLQLALSEEQFFLVYQPKWNARENLLAGWEALVRWNHPNLGVVSPGEFIPIAEETGLIIPMTRFALRQACRQCKAWQKAGVARPVSVNLSVKLFQTGGLKSMVQEALNEADLDPHLLELEITESMVLYDVREIIGQITSLREMGVRISMDDFGTGYSSIGLLDKIPLDTLKLDRLFTNDLDTPAKRTIISTIVLMAQNLHLEVVAEGVESREHVGFLMELGCQIMQGYYYGKPMIAEEADQWMKQRSII